MSFKLPLTSTKTHSAITNSCNFNFNCAIYIIAIVSLLQLQLLWSTSSIVSATIIHGAPLATTMDHNDDDGPFFPLPFTRPQVSTSTGIGSPNNNYDDDELEDYNQFLNLGRRTPTNNNNNNGDQRRLNSGNNRNRLPVNRYDDDFFLRPKQTKCDRRIRVLNGATRIRDKGSLVRFQCSYGYHMLGVSVAVCVRGQWSDRPPICVRDGCRKLPIPLQGSLKLLYGGGVAVFNCNYGFEMEGERLLSCDGQRWNGSAPLCKEMPPITIAPPSTTFPTLPRLVTTEETPNAALEPTQMAAAAIATSTLPSKLETDEITNPDIANAPTNQETDHADNEDLLLTPSSSGPFDPFLIGPTGTDENTNAPKLPDSQSQTTPQSQIHDLIITTEGSPFINVASSPPLNTPKSTTITISTTELPETTETPVPLSTTMKVSLTSNAATDAMHMHIPIPTKSPPLLSTVTPSIIRGRNTTTKIPSTFKPWTGTTTEILPWWARRRPSRAPTTTKKPIPADISPLPYNPKPKPIRPNTTKQLEIVPAVINPEKLGNSASNNSSSTDLAYLFQIAGITIAVLGSITIVGGIFAYYWRKRIGIARARSIDIDGRILNMSIGSNEEYWSENRDSGL